MPTPRELDPTILLPPFPASLPASLRALGERALLEYHSITHDNYSTERFLGGAVSESFAVLGAIPIGGAFSLNFEGRSPELVRYCEEQDLKLKNDDDSTTAIDLVHTALADVVGPYNFLLSAVGELVWRCHIVESENDDYDVSFSDPAIPFSIFISAPTRVERRSVLRVAESLIHETMHLQLTLFELCCPLIDPLSTWSMYSPWKRQVRPAQGILHGLYVFYVLRWLWQEISKTTHNEIDREFALRRVNEINEEISLVRAFEKSPALNKSGDLFLTRLFRSGFS
jgi:hypothetical protein